MSSLFWATEDRELSSIQFLVGNFFKVLRHSQLLESLHGQVDNTKGLQISCTERKKNHFVELTLGRVQPVLPSFSSVSAWLLTHSPQKSTEDTQHHCFVSVPRNLQRPLKQSRFIFFLALSAAWMYFVRWCVKSALSEDLILQTNLSRFVTSWSWCKPANTLGWCS